MCGFFEKWGTDLEAKGREEEQALYNKLIFYLSRDGRIEEIVDAARDNRKKEALCREYQLI